MTKTRSIPYEIVLKTHREIAIVGPRVLSGPRGAEVVTIEALLDEIDGIARANGLRVEALVLANLEPPAAQPDPPPPQEPRDACPHNLVDTLSGRCQRCGRKATPGVDDRIHFLEQELEALRGRVGKLELATYGRAEVP